MHVPKYGLNWYIYKVCKKNQKKVKKNLVVSFFCRTFVTEKERNSKTHNIMKQENFLDKMEKALEFVTIGFCVLVMIIVFLGL